MALLYCVPTPLAQHHACTKGSKMHKGSKMQSKQEITISWILFWTMWIFFVVIGFLTILAVYFNFGSLQSDERSTVFNLFIGEVLLSIPALYYSIFKLKKSGLEGINGQAVELERKLREKERQITTLQQNFAKIAKGDVGDPEYIFKDAIVALCSQHSNTEVEDIIKGLNLEKEDKVSDKMRLLTEIGKMKDAGIIYNASSLSPTSVRLSRA